MGKVVTFYSFKGGVGRTMALANAAVLLAQEEYRVLVVDFDLEAPGLHRYFEPRPTGDPEAPRERGGVIDFFSDLRKRLGDPSPARETGPAGTEGGPRSLVAELLDSGAYHRTLRLPRPGSHAEVSLDFMAAGRLGPDYAEQVRGFDWERFYAEHGDLLPLLADEWRRRYGYVLIDSRTGFSDAGSLCTVILPDVLVLAFVPNRQSLAGVLEVGANAVPQHPGLMLVPLLTRVENAEHARRDEWIARACRCFESLFEDVYQMDRCELTAYFQHVQIAHDSYYSYGEEIAAAQQSRGEGMALQVSRLLPFLHGYRPWEAARLREAPLVSGAVRLLTLCHPADRQERALPWLQPLARLGIRPLLPEEEGLSWPEALDQAERDPRQRQALILWSEAAEEDEGFQALAAQVRARRGSGLLVEEWRPGGQRASPEEDARRGRPVGAGPGDALGLARRVLKGLGLNQAEELVLYLGHRSSHRETPSPPPPWRHLPVLDVRAALVGERDFSPSVAEWSELRQGLSALHDLLPGLRRLHVFGQAPLGVGALVGWTWDRGGGVALQTFDPAGGQVWSGQMDAAGLEATGTWTPPGGRTVRIESTDGVPGSARHVVLALVPAAKAEFLTNIERWNGQRDGAPLLWVQTPSWIRDPEEARQVLIEVLGAIRYVRRTWRQLESLDLISTLPLAAVILLAHHLRQFGVIHFYDQVMQTKEYRLAVTFS